MNDLLTVDDLAAYLGATPTCTQAQLDTAVAIVRRHCGWHIAPSRTDTYVRTTSAPAELVTLPSLHVTAVNEVTVDDADVDLAGIAWTTNGLVRLRRAHSWGPIGSDVAVTYAHGHAIDDVADVIGIIAELAVRIAPAVTPTAAGTVAPVEETIAGYSYKLPGHAGAGVTLTDLELAALDTFRLTNTP